MVNIRKMSKLRFRKNIKLMFTLILSGFITTMFILNVAVQNALTDVNDHVMPKVKTFNTENSSVLIDHTISMYAYKETCTTPLMSDGTWIELVPHSIYVVSSFYDNRTSPPMLRMLAAVLHGKKTELWCHFNNSNGNPDSSKLKFYEMCENHNLPYGGWILSCEIPESFAVSCSVMVSTSPATDSSAEEENIVSVAIEHIIPQKQKERFAVCVPPVFGNVSASKLVEFFEMMHYLGAEKIFIYVATESRSIQRVLKFYQKKNIAILLPWKLPFDDALTMNMKTKAGTNKFMITSIWYKGQSLAINDCLYRSRLNFEYVLFSDLDEILIPKSNHYNWKSVIEAIKRDNASGYSFKSAFFDLDRDSAFMSFNSIRTLEFSPKRNKVMVHPERVFEMGIHHVSSSVPGHVTYGVYHVPESVAFIHHYRECRVNCSRKVIDTSMKEKYELFLKHAVAAVLRELNL